MAWSNYERADKALGLLNPVIKPFFAQEFQSAYGVSWEEAVHSTLNECQGGRSSSEDIDRSDDQGNRAFHGRDRRSHTVTPSLSRATACLNSLDDYWWLALGETSRVKGITPR